MIITIEDTTSNPRASATAPASFRQGNFRTSNLHAENSTGSYVSSGATTRPSDTHREVPTIDGSQQPVTGSSYQHSHLLGADQSTLHSTAGYSYQPNARALQQRLVAAMLSLAKADMSSMATTVPFQPQHHFGSLTGHYPPAGYAPYPGMGQSSAVEEC